MLTERRRRRRRKKKNLIEYNTLRRSAGRVKKSCLLLSSEAFNSYFGLLLCVTHQIVTLQIFSHFSFFSLYPARRAGQGFILLEFLLLSSSSFCQHRYFSYSLHGMTMKLIHIH